MLLHPTACTSPRASKDAPARLRARGDVVGSEEPGNLQWEEGAGAALLELGGAEAVRRALGHGTGESEKSIGKSAKAGQEGRRCWRGTGRP